MTSWVYSSCVTMSRTTRGGSWRRSHSITGASVRRLRSARRNRVSSRLGISPTASTSTWRTDIRYLTKEARRELREAIVTVAFGAGEDAAHVRMQSALAPVIAGGFLGALGLAFAGSLEQRLGGSGVVAGIVARRKHVMPLRSAR